MRASAILLVLAACGGGAHHTQDASPPDASTDTIGPATADAPSGAVTLTVTVAGAAAPNVVVFFQSSDSSLVAAAATDEHGVVGATLSGGFVTAIEPPDGSGVPKLDTFSGVRAGDALHLDLGIVATQDSATFQVTAPLDGDPRVTSYMLYTQCGSTPLDVSGTTTITLGGCGTKADMVVTSIDANGNIVHYFTEDDVPVSSAPQTLAGTYVAPAATMFSYANVPQTVTWVKTTQELWSTRGREFDASTGAAPQIATASDSLAQPATSAMLAVTVTDGAPDASQHGEQLVYDWSAWSASYALDLGSVLLPAYATGASYDVASHAIVWTEADGGAQPDVARATLHAYRDAIPRGTAWQWSVVAARVASPRLVLPTLPTGGGFDFNPSATDSVGVSDLTNVKLPGGYDAFRAHGFGPVANAIAGTSGRIVVELPYAASPP